MQWKRQIYQNKTDGSIYSLFDYISNSCVDLLQINLWAFAVDNGSKEFEMILGFFNHNHLTKLDSGHTYCQYLDLQGNKTFLELYHEESKKENIPGKYITIKYEDRNVFFFFIFFYKYRVDQLSYEYL